MATFILEEVDNECILSGNRISMTKEELLFHINVHIGKYKLKGNKLKCPSVTQVWANMSIDRFQNNKLSTDDSELSNFVKLS